MRKGILNTHSMMASLMGLLIFCGCTKSIPYKETDPNAKGSKVVDASIVNDKSAVLLMSISMQAASRSSKDALPFSTGENKRVKFEMTEDKLRIIEAEQDPRFASNTTNNKLVLEIPIEHVQFQCAKDKFGECTNTEEEAKDIPWEQKSQIRVKLDAAVSGQIDLLPIMISQTEGKDCYDLVSSRLLNSSITTEAVNFQIERTFKTKLKCLQQLDVTSDATVSAVFHYSMVRIETVLSKDYQVVSYPEGSEDESTFGFFTSKRIILDQDNNNTTQSSVQVMNRWNPNRSEIIYYLSDEFAKPENKAIKDLTYQTVGNINKGLEISGVKFRINLKEPAGKLSGDIRNSMIVLVEDPVESNIIGYGPQTEDPLTGEIISARTVMFLGTIKKFIKNTYEEIREQKLQARLAAKGPSSVTLADSLKANIEIKKASGLTAGVATVDTIPAPANADQKPKAKLDGSKSIGKILNPKALMAKWGRQMNPEMTGTDVVSRLKFQLHAKNCAFEPSAESFSGGISEQLVNSIPDTALPWEQLSEKEKADVLALVLPAIWVPTLIHEMGHNLGLRHNFKASFDKTNYFSKAELQQNNIDHDVPFSSVMDYGNDLKTLPILGKYDLAALKFGYLRQVEMQTVTVNEVTGEPTVLSSEFVPVPKTLDQLIKASKDATQTQQQLQIKPYGYCTDEHLGLNNDCKQFDLGSTFTEIIKNSIKDYESAYTKRNLRDGRANMSLTSDPAYAARITSIFKDMRMTMELVERINKIYGADSKFWTTDPFLIDLKQATVSVGTFLAKVLLVPDVTCAVASSEKPNEIVQLVNIADISPTAISCFDIQLKPEFSMVAQTGKFLNSKKDPKSKNPYLDQIDFRGIWSDKVAAAQMLLNRKIGVFSTDTQGLDSFINLPELRSDLRKVLDAIMLNNVINTVPFTLKDGSVLPLEVSYDLFTTQAIERPLVLAMAEENGDRATANTLAKKLGVNLDGKTQLQEVLTRIISQEMVDASGEHDADNAIAENFSVQKINGDVKLGPVFDGTAIVIDNATFFAGPTNNLALTAITDYDAANKLEPMDRQKLIEIYTAKQNKEAMPADATPEVQAVWKLTDEQIKNFLIGVIKEKSFYARLLNIL